MEQASRSGKAGTFLLLLVAGAGVTLYLNPQCVRVGGRTQPPVGAGVRDSLLGFDRVLQLTNEGDRPLLHVSVEAANPAHNTHGSYRFDAINPHEVKELGWSEWGWSVDAGETFRVSADDYTLPITFSSDQLGVK